MRKRRWMGMIFLLAVLLFAGGMAAEYEYRADTVTPQELIRKQEQKKALMLSRTRYGIDKKETFTYEFACDLSELPIYEWDGIITVHTERSCQEESSLIVGVEVVSRGKGCQVTISPIEPALATRSDDEEERSWGSAPVYYLAIRYDRNAKKRVKLDQPEIIPFTLKSPCSVPNLKGELDKDGMFRLRWNPVKGAKEYRIYNYWSSKEGKTKGAETGYHDGTLLFEKCVSGTSYEEFSGREPNTSSLTSYRDGKELVTGQNYSIHGDYYVTAVVDGQESSLSNAVCTGEYKLPHQIVEEKDILFERFASVKDLPRSVPVENTDGSVEQRNVLYTLCAGKDILGRKRAQYDYQVEGTCLNGYVVMNGKKEQTYPEKIGTPSLAGRRMPRDELDKVPQPDKKSRQDSSGWGHKESRVTVAPSQYEVVADSAAEEWLALNLLAGETEFYIGDFPELTEPESLRELFYRVYYQNPFVFGIASFSCDYEQLLLKVEYFYSVSERETMRQQMYEKALSILRERDLLGENKSTADKIHGIYQWLEENTSYDTEAYEDSVAGNYEKTGQDYEYAGNAWGMLVKRRGMCQGYSDAFLLLCRMAGVEAVAVTGYIGQSIPHVWNAVRLEGSWYYVDATNNYRNTGQEPCLYLAGEEQAARMFFVRDGKAFGGTEKQVIISKKNFADHETFS